MIRLRVLASAIAPLAITVLLMGGALLSLNSCGGSSGSSAPPPPPGKIQHVVVIVQENRSVDNLFQDPMLYNPPRSADIVQSGTNSQNKTIPLQQMDLAAVFDPDHSHTAFNSMCQLSATTGQCQMNGADLIR